MLKKIQELKNMGEQVKIKIKKGATDLINKIKDNAENVVLGGSIVALIGAITIAGFTVGKNYEIFKNYSTSDELSDYCESLECDTSYILKANNELLRMKHNNGEPIYVYIDEDISDLEKKYIKQSLDKMFGIVGSINNKYHYEIVNKSKYDSQLNKTRIYYTYGEL